MTGCLISQHKITNTHTVTVYRASNVTGVTACLSVTKSFLSAVRIERAARLGNGGFGVEGGGGGMALPTPGVRAQEARK